MKKYVIMFILCFIVLFAGCARPNNDKKRIILSKRYYKICRDYDYLKSLNRKYFIDYDKYNESYFKDNKPEWYEMPENVVGVLVNPIDGTLATKESKKKKILYFIKGTEPIS